MAKTSTEKKVEEAVKAVAEECKTNKKDCGCGHKHHGHAASGGAVYGLGLIGAAVYFIQQADSFWMGLLGILKAIIWPAMLVYEALKYFKI